jgi:hypothetical protein
MNFAFKTRESRVQMAGTNVAKYFGKESDISNVEDLKKQNFRKKPLIIPHPQF